MSVDTATFASSTASEVVAVAHRVLDQLVRNPNAEHPESLLRASRQLRDTALLIGETRMAIRNLYQLVTLHQQRHDEEEEKEMEIDTDYQLVKVEEFVNDLSKITTEISRDGYAFYAPPSSQ